MTNNARLLFFFFNDTATTEIYTLSLHDALPICSEALTAFGPYTDPHDETFWGAATAFQRRAVREWAIQNGESWVDRKSTRLNSSHSQISYAVFCLKKKKINTKLYLPMYEYHTST